MRRLGKYLFRLLLVAGVFGTTAYFADNAFGAVSRVKIKKKSTVLRNPFTLNQDNAEEYNADKAAILSQKRHSLIEDIKRFIRDSRDGEQVAELNLRLGKLYMEDYYASLSKAQQDFDKTHAVWEKTKKGKEPSIDASEAKASLNRAKTVYKDLLRRAPNHPRRDEVLYFLAVSTLDDGKVDEAMRYFQRIARETPKSKFYGESLVQLADYFFEKNKFREAEVYYDKLISIKYAPLFPYAVYKKAWCAHNRESYPEAIKQFKWVIGFADSDSDSSALRIRGEAIRDIALSFGELHAVQDALEFYRSLGMPHHRSGLESLAAISYEKGRFNESIKIDEQLLELDKNYAKNSDYGLRIFDALKGLGRDDLATKHLISNLPTYVTKSSWYEMNSNSPGVVQGAVKSYEEVTRGFATNTHAIAQKTKNEALYTRAKTLYEKYVEFFPHSENLAQMRFSLGEILFRQHTYLEAAEQYYKAYQDPRVGKLKKDAIRYALAALDKQVDADRKKAGLGTISSKSTSKLNAKEDESLQPIAYSDTEKKFLAVSDEYLKHYPTAKDAGDVLYEQTYLNYMHHEFSDAYKGFSLVIQKYPSHETAPSSAYLILDILNRKKDYSKLIAACQKFLDTKELKQPAFRSEVADILRKAELKRIALLEEKEHFKEAAESYVEYTRTYGPQDEALLEKALFNAAVNYTKANMLVAAVEVQERFLRRFPKSRYRENMVLQVAKTHETLASFEKAGKYFEEFANTYPSNTQSKNALRLAGLYLGGTGHMDRAEAIFSRLQRAFPNESKQIEHDLLSLYESQGASEKVFRYYLSARSARGISYSEYLAYTIAAAEVAASRTGKLPPSLMEEAFRVSDKFGAEIRKSPKGVEALAKTRFWWVSQRETQLHRYTLSLPQERMAANLKRKLLLLQELEREYAKIASLGNAEWGLGAIYKTAAIYRHMAQSVETAPVPPELNAEALTQYREEIKRQMVDPFNEKARGFAASCLDKAQEFNVLSPWTPLCYGLAAELDPSRYPRARTFYLPSVVLSVQEPGRNSKTEMGSLKNYSYPFYSSGLFSSTRQVASVAPEDPTMLYDMARTSDTHNLTPNSTNYESLANERTRLLKRGYDSEKPDDIRKGGSFAFLNILRVASPSRSIPLIENAIARDPENTALVNLLGLAYLEAGKPQTANTCWMSLIARGAATGSVWNNLGVAAIKQGHEPQAMAYFQEAIKSPDAKEAWINLGFLALKYRNGVEARGYFKKALQMDDDDAAARAGWAVAAVQSRDLEEAKETLQSLSRKLSKDPYVKLSLGYYLVDVDQESETAHKIISEYMESESLEKDLAFRQLLMEARRGPRASGLDDAP